MARTIKVALAGAGAFGIRHLDGIRNIDGVEVVSLAGRRLDATKEVAAKYGIAHVSTDLADSLALKEVDAVVLCTPTQMHASQSIACLKAGKHVQVEIPLADPGAMRRPSPTCRRDRACDVRPYPPVQPQPPMGASEDRRRDFNIQQMDADILLPPVEHDARQPRSWTDQLQGYYAAHKSTCSPIRHARRS